VEAREEATTKEVDRLHQVLYDNTGVREFFCEFCCYYLNN